MKMQSAVEEYLVEIEVRKYTPKTIRSYRCNLNLFLRFCAEKLHVEIVEALTPAVVRQFSRCMSEAGRKGTYINGVLKSIKSFIQYCYEEGYGGFDTRKTFKWCKEEKPVITAFSPEQVRSMLQSCRGHDYLSLRDYAILTLLFETGIRCWELCCIREEDIHNDFIIINGKNHKQRVVPITPVLKKAMLRYESGKEKSLGVAQYVTWPRTVCSIMGCDVKGKPLTGDYGVEVEDYVIDEESAIVSKTTGKPLKTTVYKKTVKQLYPSLAQMKKADGFKANAAFFKLGFLDKNAVALGRQFKELLPVLWLKAGAYGPCPSLEGEKDVPAMLVLQQNHFAVLTDEAQYEAFAEQVNSEDAITTVYIVTDSEPGYRDMISGLHAENTYQLYRDYLDNFRINHGGR